MNTFSVEELRKRCTINKTLVKKLNLFSGRKVKGTIPEETNLIFRLMKNQEILFYRESHDYYFLLPITASTWYMIFAKDKSSKIYIKEVSSRHPVFADKTKLTLACNCRADDA